MREIKFRAWDKMGKRMFYSRNMVYFALNQHIWDTEDNNMKLSLMQYTGLKDKNGKEIYDGDICHFEFGEGNKLSGNGKVYWCDGGAYWGARTKLPFLLHQCKYIEIVGNIYENAELIKGE